MRLKGVSHDFKRYALRAVTFLLWIAAGYLLKDGNAVLSVGTMLLGVGCDYIGDKTYATRLNNGHD